MSCVNFLKVLFVAFALLGGGAAAQAATVQAFIDLSSQKMTVSVDGRVRYKWPVSTARRGYRTPVGQFTPGRMYERYFSKKYHGSPMPYSVFFYHGYAIHGTTAVENLGRPASHGCVRLHPDNAKRLFSLISRNGKANTRIIIRR